MGCVNSGKSIEAAPRPVRKTDTTSAKGTLELG